MKKVCDSKNTNPPYYYPYWLDIIFLPQTKLYEVHGSSIQNPQSAIYKVTKVAPYSAQHSTLDFEPHMSLNFLNEITKMEQKLIEEKLIV